MCDDHYIHTRKMQIYCGMGLIKFYTDRAFYMVNIYRLAFLGDGNLATLLQFNSGFPNLLHVFAPISWV